MIEKYTLNDHNLVLKGEGAGEFPLYIFLSDNKKILLYSYSINELLNDPHVKNTIQMSEVGISFLLQSGVVPPPRTAYKNIFILGIGDKVKVSSEADSIILEFSHNFPFMNSKRLTESDMQPDEDLILEMLAEATISRLDTKSPSFLFHSAGKDSNSIALAIAEAGWQDKITLITHKSKGKADESGISAKIAKQLGYKHIILNEIDNLNDDHKKEIEKYFYNAPFPCVDNVSLAYPLYAYQVSDLKGANLIFGDGNDSHMISPPSKREIKYSNLSKYSAKLDFLRGYVNSESVFSPFLRTPAEWFGVSGFSFKDSKAIYSDSESVYSYWNNESKIRVGWDIFDYKSDIYSTRTITERMIRKLHNFADVNNANIVLPFANERVAEYFGKMPESYLFSRETFKNKLILRKILKERMGLDSDIIGKMGWTYDSHAIIFKNWDWVLKEMKQSSLWEQDELFEVVCRLKKVMHSTHKYSGLSGRLIYQLFLLSAWSNRNKYLKDTKLPIF
ncbi:asparagine synthase-related protein [Pseudoalteromonas neustonica]|uniref:asparagine synthase-related protein n=1 Tax=Pseudoalteromonas neustonica TaxID=1840331 RepID=UPI0007DB51D7|nr:asparagine synthase-related protein [Pseudoalteromonas neustonica]